MKQQVVIFGAGQIADLSHHYLTHDSDHEVVAFTVDGHYITSASHRGLPVVAFEDVESAYPPSHYGMMIAISFVGMNAARAEKYTQAKAKGYNLITYVSSRSATWPDLVIGDNCRIHDGAVIQPFAEIGNNVIIGSGSVICHHTVIRDHCFIAGGATVSGNVTVEPFCFIGAGASIRDGIKIARGCVIGAGAVVLKDTQENGVYRGQPPILLPRSSDSLPRI